MHYEMYVGQPLVSDDAGQFKISGLLHALCWLHAERSIRKLVPLSPREQEAIDGVRDAVWKYYQRLRTYRQSPTPQRQAALERDFDRLFRRRTGFADLNEALRRIHEKRDDLLLVLERPEIPLHNNLSESDIREATELACEAVKTSGMGSIRGSIQVKSTATNTQLHFDVNEEIKKLLETAEKLAEQTLQQEWRLLITMADYLSNNRLMNKSQIEQMISAHAQTRTLASIRNENYPLGYRNVLQELANQIAVEKKTSMTSALGEISLNKTNP